MSASSLPSELWRSIFRHAVNVPRLLDVDWNSEPEERFWAGWGSMPDGRSVIAVKRTIVLVCREWRELGRELLYEVVSIPGYTHWDDYARLGQLVALFRASAKGSSMSRPGHGWWTKRIDCHVDLLNINHVEHLLSLLEQCHNLEILAVSRRRIVPTGLQSRLARILRSRFSHSLRRLDWYLDEGNAENPVDYGAVLPSVHLTTLGIVVREPYLDCPLLTLFEDVTTLSLYFPIVIRQPPPHWILLRLKTLELIHLGTSDLPATRAFIERHHETLVNLRIETTDSDIPSLTVLISGHPNIRTLTFDDQDLLNLGQIVRAGDDPKLPVVGLSYLGVTRTRIGQAASKMQQGLESIFEGRALPDLRMLRLLSETSPLSIEADTWQHVIDMCREHNVLLEDMHGKLVLASQSSEPATEICGIPGR